VTDSKQNDQPQHSDAGVPPENVSQGAPDVMLPGNVPADQARPTHENQTSAELDEEARRRGRQD